MEKGSGNDLQSRPWIEEEALGVNNVDVKESLRFENIPSTTPRPLTSATKCRKVLGHIKNMT